MIYISYFTSVYLLMDIYWGLFHLWLIFNCILCYPHLVLVSTSCSSRNFLIFLLLFSQKCLTYFLWLLNIYSSKYSPVFLHFTNWLFLYSYSSLCLSYNLSQVLQFKGLRISQRKRTLYWLTQENSIKFLSTIYLSYIHFAYGLYYTNLAYSKGTYVKHAIITLLLLEPSTTFYYDMIMWLCDCDMYYYINS